MKRLTFLSGICAIIALTVAADYAKAESQQLATKKIETQPLKHQESPEHTEHPEHPEHPKKPKKEKPSLTADELADAIKKYVDEKSAEKDGHFEIYDDKAGKNLKLSLLRVHRKRLAKVGEDLYFACADFKTPKGKIYDLDFFMEGKDKDSLKFTDVSIHKEAGKERYTWYEENGIWKKKPVEASPKIEKAQPKKPRREHPEHPKEHTK